MLLPLVVSLPVEPHHPPFEVAGVFGLAFAVLAIVAIWSAIGEVPFLTASRETRARVVRGASGAVLAVAAVLLFLWAASISNSYNDKLEAWGDDLAVWAEDTYGVTAGTEDLNYQSRGFGYVTSNRIGDVVADGTIRSVELRFVGDQAFLLDHSAKGNVELPRKR